MDLLDRQHFESRRPQLDRQRNPVQPAANLGDGLGVRFGHGKPGLNQTGPVDKQTHRLALRHGIGRERLSRVRQRQRGDAPDGFSIHAERFPAGHQDVQPRRRAQQRLDQRRTGGDQVLTVIEQQQELPGTEVVRQRFDQRSDLPLSNVQHRCHRLHDERRLRQGRQIHGPDAVTELIAQTRRDLKRQPRLAAPTRAG